MYLIVGFHCKIDSNIKEVFGNGIEAQHDDFLFRFRQRFDPATIVLFLIQEAIRSSIESIRFRIISFSMTIPILLQTKVAPKAYCK